MEQCRRIEYSRLTTGLNCPLSERQRARPDVLLQKLTDQGRAVQVTLGHPADTPTQGTPLQPEEDKRRRAVRKS